MLGAIGLAVSGAGSILGAFGASKSAKEQKRATKKAIRDINALYDRQSKELDTLTSEKEDKLYNLGDIFDRFESTGAFGDTDALENLRKAQSDFSRLAAGDFSGFEEQIQKSLSDTLINTVGAGAPVGAFAGLAADQQMSFRLQGIQTATNLSDFMASQSQNLLGLEFGIMDQNFSVGYDMDANRVNAINEARMVGAKTAGIGMTGFGNALSGIGSGLFSYSQGLEQRQLARDIAQIQYGPQRLQPSAIKEYASPIDSFLNTPSYAGDVPLFSNPLPDAVITDKSIPALDPLGDFLPDPSSYGYPLLPEKDELSFLRR